MNTYLVASNTEGILALEAYLARKNPKVIRRFSIQFGIPHLLAKDPREAESFFRDLLSSPRLADRDWMRWNHAFSLLQLKKPDEARTELAALADNVADPVLLLLAVYLLDALAKDDAGLSEKITAKRNALQAKHSPATFQKTIEKSGGNMQVVVLSRLLQDAVQWLFAGSAKPADSTAGSVAVSR